MDLLRSTKVISLSTLDGWYVVPALGNPRGPDAGKKYCEPLADGTEVG
jgi:hypothetical protein